MKVETPQILWNAEDDKGLNAALLSITITASLDQHILCTAGNTPVIHLWKMTSQHETPVNHHPDDMPDPARTTTPSHANDPPSHHGRVFVTPPSPQSPATFLCSLTRHEAPINAAKFSPDGIHLATAGDAGVLIIWSVPLQKRGNDNGRHYWAHGVQAESDLSVKIVSLGVQAVCDLAWSHDGQKIVIGTIDSTLLLLQKEIHNDNWSIIYRGKDHTHFVQGVTSDPRQVYLMTSVSSDRSARIYQRKPNTTNKKSTIISPNDIQKTKVIKMRTLTTNEAPTGTLPDQEHDENQQHPLPSQPTTQRQHLFCDENTLNSFVRRPDWTPDGAYLCLPAGLDSQGFCAYLFARHVWDTPARVLQGISHPVVAVITNPVLFALEEKENDQGNPAKRPHRSILAILTTESVIMYDTHHTQPLAVVQGIHYANLTDAAWTSDGHTLAVSSSDGYVTFVHFSLGELGRPLRTSDQYPVPLSPCEPGPMIVESPPTKKAKLTAVALDAGVRQAKKRVAPTLVSSST